MRSNPSEPQHEAQNKGYRDGANGIAYSPFSDLGTEFMGHLRGAYGRGYSLGRKDWEASLGQDISNVGQPATE